MRYRMSEGLTNIGTPLKEAMERTPRPKEPEQEPVARSDAYDMIDRFLQNNLNSDADYAEYLKALDSIYTTPPQRKPLTDEDIFDNLNSIFGDPKHHKIPLTRGQIIDFGRKMFDLGTRPCTTPPQRQWVGLTDDEREQMVDLVIADKKTKDQIGDLQRMVEAKLKEKNT